MSDRRIDQGQQPRRGELAGLFLKLGLIAFGGPAAHIAMLESEVVSRRRWIDRQHFLDLVGATNLIPGPNSTEMVMHVGYERGGRRGLLVAGACFILPAVALTGGLAWLYVGYGTLPEVEPLLRGIKPAVIAVILGALWSLGRKAVKGWRLAAIGGVTALAVGLGVNEVVGLIGGGLAGGLWLGLRRSRRSPDGAAALLPPFLSRFIPEASGATTTVGGAGGGAPAAGPAGAGIGAAGAAGGGIAATGAAASAVPVSLLQLFLFFLKVGCILYGSGYVLVAFLRGDLVEGYGWLTDAQLLDAIAIGQFTPGPVLSTATFIGYLVAGGPGAVVATVGIFLPSFLLVLALNPWVPRLRSSPWSAAFLDAVNVAAVALMAVVTVQLGMAALTSWPAWLIALASAVLALRFGVGAAWLVVGGAVTGWALGPWMG